MQVTFSQFELGKNVFVLFYFILFLSEEEDNGEEGVMVASTLPQRRLLVFLEHCRRSPLIRKL